MSADLIFSRLMQRIEHLEAQVNLLQRKQNNIFREGRVTEIDAQSGTAVVDAQGIESAMIPWLQRSGDIRDWEPPTVGERIILLSPTGDPGRGMILPGGYSDQFPQPHQKAAEAFRVVGDTSRNQKSSQYHITTPHHLVDSPSVDLGGKGGPAVARVGDFVEVLYGSSKGLHPIVTGSEIVRAK